ncbi:type I restriction-modification system endonuclease [Microcoleus sp. FACHB-831]|uniref:type I restriction-modification system endonuclease n=1 Tax=Microcoleus sp. FACHB-831 TaxID=2692827 RepID=UPI0016894ED2|nr:type I restriction-modification system endonuclease [Microcoleus sp. FACHB-831]MBD1924244.1 type I restriction-modification system endonuclease [Microcoleus sp. FACHB-831]
MPQDNSLKSPNFAFLGEREPQLLRLGTLAEQYFVNDPVTCLMKLRQFGELLAQLVAANFGQYDPDAGESQIELLNRLRDKGYLPGRTNQLFHELRRAGNDANHALSGDHRTALSNLKYARELGIWFHRSFGRDANFKAGAFIPPPDPLNETQALQQELERLRQEADERRSAVEMALAKAAKETELRQLAEQLLEEAEAEAKTALNNLAELQARTVSQPAEVLQQTLRQVQQAEKEVVLDEAETRRLIDAQLRAAGWEVDSEELKYNNGTRPQKGKNLAIAEYPTADGRADYALFVGLQVVAVVEAKRQSKDVSAAIDQAKRYSRGYQIKGDEIANGNPWGEFKVPFVFATNGREFLEQLRTKSGIWFCDLRRPENLRRPLPSWYSPQGLVDTLSQDLEEAHRKLAEEGFSYNLKLRDYQIKAIQKVEAELADNKRQLLIAMATGTGKTKTCIALVYRLLKTKRFRRVLFLVDRTALGEQSANAFKDSRMESLQTFADIFEIKELGDRDIDSDTKVHIATVQSFVKRLIYPSEKTVIPTVDLYDCIVVDECHRGYLLDQELSETQLTFRDFNDYISKYRRVLDYFDAVKIGLTATPALHTTQIFGEPVFTYSYPEAVIDGWLIDHEPPYEIKTALSEDGIVWNPGDQMEFFDPKTGELDLVHAPDTVRIDVDKFNRRVVTKEFNRVVCEYLAENIDPALPGKTLIFCVNTDHADMVVDQLKLALEKQYGSVEDDAVLKITGNADKPMQLIRRFKNEANPKIAVTVDLLTTGIDVPEICNLVFMRRVNSRILYDQMIGRATRLCDEIGKEVFRVFDAVDIYSTISKVSEMKPVVKQPNISFSQLVDELGRVKDSTAIACIIDELLAKLQRKKRSLSDDSKEAIALLANMSVDDVVSHLRESSPTQAAQWLRDKKAIAEVLDRRDGGLQAVLISHHPNVLRSVERGYGKGEKPQDYLNSFNAFLGENLNKIPALLVVTQRPRELTRSQLKEVRLLLDAAGFSETNLQVAWRETTNEDIAASIIGFIRQAALGNALVPYGDRVDKAMKKILASRAWTAPQRKWLERIGQQLKTEVIVDRDAFDRGAFKAQGGGFERINKAFDGRLEEILVDINEALWQEMA